MFDLFRESSGSQEYPSDWEDVSTEILNRDDYTCQRCGHQSGPHADDSGRVLQTHHVVSKSEGGSDNADNLTTLCLPCHGVQHPNNSYFDEHRTSAPLFPPSGSDTDVAYVCSATRKETTEEYLDRKGRSCCRCWGKKSDSDLFLYPLSDLTADDGCYPLESYLPLCRSCLSVVTINDDSISIQKLSSLLIRYDDPFAPIDVEAATADVESIPTWSYHPHAKFCVYTRNDDSIASRLIVNMVTVSVVSYLAYILGISLGR